MEEKIVMKPHAIMIAVPYQGHLNPFVHLAIKLASKGFTITFVHTEEAHHRIVRSHQNYNTTTSTNEVDIFSEARNSGLDIHYTTISDGFPVDYDRNNNFLEYWESILNDFPSHVDEFVGNLIQSFDPLSVPLLVADTLNSWPGTIAKKHNLVYVSFWTEPAAVFAIGYHTDLLRENGHFPRKDNHECIISYIPGVESISTKDLMAHLQKSDDTTIIHKIVFMSFDDAKKADFILHNTIQELEPHTLSALNREKPTYAIGPVNFPTKINVSKSLLPETDCTTWLASKPSGSVLYVSFGSVVQINKQVIEEIAQALILCTEVTFIWAIRPQTVSFIDDTHVLPVGFEDSVKDRGLIVPWCNQNAVLSDPAVGGFLTHCGWNSILESIWCGVPMICCPIMYDQPTNRKLVVDDWKIGINISDHDITSVNREEVAVNIKKLMSGETSGGIRNEMKKFKNILHNALIVDGSSERNLNRFLKDLGINCLP